MKTNRYATRQIQLAVAAIYVIHSIVSSVSANNVIYPAWQAEYASSLSDDVSGCQLCHQNPNGGNGWNAYGWDVRAAYRSLGGPNPARAISAIRGVEENDSDDDILGTPNRIEIYGDSQPGWKAGGNNTICFSNESCIENQTAPDFEQLNSDLIPFPIPKGVTISLQPIAAGFVAPNLAVSAPGIIDSLFVVDQVGAIWQVNIQTGIKREFINVGGGAGNLNQLVSNLGQLFQASNYDERGLLGLAFHPQFQSNGLFYTYQSEDVNGAANFSTTLSPDHQTVIAQWQVELPITNNPIVDIDSKRVVLRIDQPQFNHNGGMIAFGPNDGYLYVGLGDGGEADDEGEGHSAIGNAQDTNNPLGSILRINPLSSGGYSVPPSNPYVGDNSVIDEIYAYGLRNPFRFSFDSLTGDLYVADVGQNDIEEINLITAGGNYGWNYKEGELYFYPVDENTPGYASYVVPDPAPLGTLIDPIFQYEHDEGLSAIGGFVYYGSDLPDLLGSYLFGDWSKEFARPEGRLFYSSDAQVFREFVVRNDINFFINGFGQDTSGNVFVMGNTTGVLSGTTGVLKKLVLNYDESMCWVMATKTDKIITVCL